MVESQHNREAHDRNHGSRPPAVHFRGIVLGPSGFAAEGREWLQALEHAGCRPSLEGASFGHLETTLPPTEQQLVSTCARRQRQGHDTVFHHLPVSHFSPDPGAARNIVSALFEADGLPPGWADRLNRADIVLVRCEWARASFARAGVAPHRLRVLPPPFAATAFAPGQHRAERTRPFVWLSVFDWTLRKGPDLLVSAFAQAFQAGEAELWIKIPPHHNHDRETLEAKCAAWVQAAGQVTPPRIRLLDRLLDASGLRELYTQANGFVLASRGEGWGRPVHEALLMELPVVATAATALGTLLPDDSVGFPVAAQTVPVSAAAAAQTPCYTGLSWSEPKPGELRRRLRQVVDAPEMAGRRAKRGRRFVLDLCDPERISSTLAAIVAD